MKLIRLATWYKPGQSHIDSLKIEAELAMKVGAISNMPTITVSQPDKYRWYITISYPIEDNPFWLGFCIGKMTAY